MSEAVHKMVDEELDDLEKRLVEFYSRASDELEKKAETYFDRFQKRDIQKQKLVEDGKMTKEQYASWRQGQMMTGQRWKDFRSQAARSLTEANKQAVEIMNGRLPEIYAMNFNEVGKEGEAAVKGIAFDLVKADTVAYLAKKDQNLLPYKEIDDKKYVRWNEKQITSEVMQGILQGESVDKLAKRFEKVVGMNRESAMRNARTTFTSAENKGTLDGMNRLTDMGLIVKKAWLATHDGRTRKSHLHFEGIGAIDLEDEFSEGLMYPADPDCQDPEEVYNCRCSLETVIVGYNGAQFDREYGHVVQQHVVEGEDISESWHRRSDEFDFEIEDVINAQGFDGRPRIVSEEEFERLVEKANDGNGFIAQRAYSATDKETLDAYREQLYYGDWYVDCSTGGAQYGQGMYCAADYNGQLTEGIKTEMEHYRRTGEDRLLGEASFVEKLNKMKDEMIENNASVQNWEANEKLFSMSDSEFAKKYMGFSPNSYTETFTLDPSAKIITFGKACGEYARELEKLGVGSYDNLFEAIVDGDESFGGTKLMNVGAYAALKGYDAINAVRRGQSGSYTVILNRTKLIIKESGK